MNKTVAALHRRTCVAIAAHCNMSVEESRYGVIVEGPAQGRFVKLIGDELIDRVQFDSGDALYEVELGDSMAQNLSAVTAVIQNLLKSDPGPQTVEQVVASFGRIQKLSGNDKW